VVVPTRSQDGLFSAVTSAFVVDVQSKFQPDLSDETAALIRVLTHGIDNTTFGNGVPTVPQWAGPQAIALAQDQYYRRMDHILGQLYRGVEYLRQHNPTICGGYSQSGENSRRYFSETDVGGNTTWSRAMFMCALPLA